MVNETGQEDIFKVDVKEMKKTFKFCTIGDEERWRVKMIKELADVRQGTLKIENYDREGPKMKFRK